MISFLSTELILRTQFCITIGLLLASVVTYALRNRQDTGQYRIPIAIQFAWAIVSLRTRSIRLRGLNE